LVEVFIISYKFNKFRLYNSLFNYTLVHQEVVEGGTHHHPSFEETSHLDSSFHQDRRPLPKAEASLVASSMGP
jgi:hypothetical protein